ncbi:MAG: hypothetical protein WA005_05855 [Candidatus Binataceae bacterium]
MTHQVVSSDQPAAIEALNRNLLESVRHQVLLGVTGSGKTIRLSIATSPPGQPAVPR